MSDPKLDIELAVKQTLRLNVELEKMMAAPEVQIFLEAQKLANEKSAETWKKIEELMIAGDIKKVEGDWGSLTIAERLDFDINEDELPPRYKKIVPDTTKIRTMYQLDRKDIAGAVPKYKNYLVKRLKIGGKND